MIIIYLLIILVTVCILHFIFNHNEAARILKKIPGPKDVFLVGNAGDINVDPVALFKLRNKYAKEFNGIYRIWIYPLGIVNIYNPEDIEIVTSTNKHSDKSIIYKFLKPWLNDGLLVSKGTKWHERRKILTPTFHFNILRQFCTIMEENSSRLVNKLDTVLGQPVDVTPIITEYTLSTICETAMGTQLNKETTECGKSYKEAIYAVGDVLVNRFTNLRYYSDTYFNLSSLGRKQKKHLKTVHYFTKKVIEERKKLVTETNITETEDESVYMFKKKRRTAMLDLLIAAQRDGLIDQAGVQEEVDTFMFEGHDTTAVGLIFFLMVLANRKDIQDKIVAELKEIFGDSQKNITIEDLSKMRYLECCIKESLRLYPPVHFISRNISETVKLSNYTVPAGTICHIHIYDLHRQENLFENPLEFIPERFLPEKCIGRHPYAYIPFSAGPRNCIGQRFAIYEMKSFVAAILRNYKLMPVTRPEDIEFVSDIVLRSNGPVYVQFEKRVDSV
uniref:CYP4M25 protein n=1 Tax=Cnaphalocrocis medinalis TaxID=437488 RepID=C1LZ55_CNAME|nr:CYP4M25 protein [Cnaphalocrocis medinalis]